MATMRKALTDESGPTPVPIPLSLPPYKKGTKRSSRQSSSWERFQAWVGRSTGLSLEILFLFALIGLGLLVGVWYFLDEI